MKSYCNIDCGTHDCPVNLINIKPNESALFINLRGKPECWGCSPILAKDELDPAWGFDRKSL